MAEQENALRLLLIDDDAAFRRLVKRVAEPHGFEVVATEDPTEFKKAVQSWQPKLVITDLNMPRMDGVEILRDLAENKCNASVVIASGIDGRTLDATCRLGAERGLKMDGVLQKPVPLEELEKLFLRHKPLDRAALTSDLAEAISPEQNGAGHRDFAAEQFYLEYQPKVSSARGTIVGVESLVRWNHPRLGLIRPDRFIPIAEQTDLIDPLTDWIFSAAASQGADWQSQGLNLEVAVNVSAKNLHDINLPDRLRRKCQECNIDPALITIEVTETSAMSDAVHMLDVLSRLRIKGFKLSLDDFGTGYSSLIQLRKMPFSELKIDISFVMAMLKDKDSRFIVEITIDLARKLGVRSVAEGVESETIWAALLEMGCDIGQGYYLGRPMGAERVTLATLAAKVAHKEEVPVGAK